MKTFIYKVLIYLLPIIVIAFSMELLLRVIPNDYKHKKQYLDVNSNSVENLFLGSSHAYYGINPEFVLGNSFNASHISQSINWDYEIIKKYENRWGDLKFIIIPIDYFTLFSRVSTGVELWRIKNYNIYYDFNYSYKLSENSELLSVNFKPNLKRIYSYFGKNNSSITCSKLGFGHSVRKGKNLIETGKTAAERHTKSDLSYFNESVSILQSILSISKRNNTHVIFYSSPAYYSYVSNLDRKQLDLSIKKITEIVNNNSHSSYYNLLEEKSFVETDYYDADHLNPSGAKKLSLILNKILIKEKEKVIKR